MVTVVELRDGLEVRLEEHEIDDDVGRLLDRERAPLQSWLAAAHALLGRGDGPGFVRLLEEASEGRRPGSTFDRIQVLCCLAAYFVHQAVGERDRKVQSDLTTRASKLVYDALQLDLGEQLPHLVLGQMSLAKGDIKAARAEFVRASERTCNKRCSIAGQLALANLSSQQHNYTEAAQLYKEALRRCPDCPAEVRLGLAVCYFKLGNLHKAMAAYERVLDLSPSSTPALLGLAVLKMQFGSSHQDVREGSQLLVQAFQQDPQNQHLLVLLAHFCLRQSFPAKALRLAQRALQLATSDAVRAEALTIVARAHHALNQLQEAYRHYQQASQLDGEQALPKYGLAQLSLVQGEVTNAASILESILADAPAWVDALQVLGVLYPKLPGSKAGKALAHFKEAAARQESNAELWEVLGDVLAAVDPAGALQAYSKAIELHRTAQGRGGEPLLPARLVNNAAVLHMRAGNTREASSLMQAALASVAANSSQPAAASMQVTLGYNMARIHEAAGELSAAEAEYQALLQQFPHYGDCLLRLASMAKARGDARRAEDLAKQAEQVPSSDLDGLVLRAGMHLERREFEPAKKLLDEVMARASDGKHEAYAKVGLGNVHLYSAPSDRRREDQAAKAEERLSHAMELYRRALERDEGNIYAANGLGCVFAEMGDLDSAKDVFLQVQEMAAASSGFWHMPDAWTNLANVYLAQEQYTSAIKMYGTTLKKSYGGQSAAMALYLARALYDADQLPAAKRTLCRAMHLEPSDHKLRFNVALTMQEWAVRTLRKQRPPGDPSKVQEFRQALREMERAYRLFSHLHQVGPVAAGVEESKLHTHINFIAETHTKAQQHVKQAEKEQVEAEKRRYAQRQQLLAAQRQRELEEEKQRLEAEALRKYHQQQAAQQAARVERLKQEWRDSGTQQKAAEKGEAAAMIQARKQQAASRQADELDALFADEDEDDDYDPLAQDPEFATGDNPMGHAPAAAEEEEAEFEEEEEEDGGESPPAASLGGGGSDLEDAGRKPRRSKGSKPKSRLKKKRLLAAAPAGLGGSSNVDDGGGAATGDAEAARKRARIVSSDEEED